MLTTYHSLATVSIKSIALSVPRCDLESNNSSHTKMRTTESIEHYRNLMMVERQFRSRSSHGENRIHAHLNRFPGCNYSSSRW